jgi:hypothetical protein
MAVCVSWVGLGSGPGTSKSGVEGSGVEVGDEDNGFDIQSIPS